MEVQRLANLVPFSVPHRTTAPTILNGYNIPNDTFIIPLLWSVHMDETEFPNPHEFNPDRFLGEDGKTLRKIDGFMPFSTGKRVCLGESLAKMELFFFITGLVSRYAFSFDGGLRRPNPDDYNFAITISPKPFKIIATPRF